MPGGHHTFTPQNIQICVKFVAELLVFVRVRHENINSSFRWLRFRNTVLLFNKLLPTRRDLVLACNYSIIFQLAQDGSLRKSSISYEGFQFLFLLITKLPPVSAMIKKELNLEKGSSATGRETVGVLKKAQVEKIAQAKLADLNCEGDLEAAKQTVKGTAKSMGIKVED